MNTLITLAIFSWVGFSSVLCVPNIDDQYIIKLKPGTNTTQFISKSMVKSKNGELTPLNKQIKHVYSVVFDGFSAKLDKAQVSSIEKYNEIEIMEKNQIAKAYDVGSINSEWITQTDAPWGLARISAKEKLSNSPFSYKYRSSGGDGVTIYVIDSGVNAQHVDFGGRAVTGINFVYYESANDLNGHGTHVSGTVAGSKYGIAKKANIIAVKVLDRDGLGSWDDIIAGIEWVVRNATTKRSVINLSLGGLGNSLVDIAIQRAVNNSITTVVAAGNSWDNSCIYSPAREPLAITVAASDITDTSAWFTSYGTCVDLYAPGVEITSTWIGTTTNISTISGTSMASPHVAGLAACLIAEYNQTSPQYIDFLLKSMALPNVLSNVPVSTINLLAHNSCIKLKIPIFSSLFLVILIVFYTDYIK